jgi:hypothetical protein
MFWYLLLASVVTLGALAPWSARNQRKGVDAAGALSSRDVGERRTRL